MDHADLRRSGVDRPQSALMLAARITLAHFSVSSAMRSGNARPRAVACHSNLRRRKLGRRPQRRIRAEHLYGHGRYRKKNFSYESLDARNRNPFGSRVFHHRRSPIYPCWGGRQGSSMGAPRPVLDRWTDRGAHCFFLFLTSSCLSRGGPSGVVRGDWAHPRPAITHAPRGAFPLKNQTGATKFKNRPSPRPPDGRVVRKFYYPRVQNWLELRENKPK